VYEYVFYKFYCLERVLFDAAPEYTALGSMIIVEGLNTGFLLGLVEWCFGTRLIPPLSKLQILGVRTALALPHYFVLVHRGRFKRIATRFSGESRRQGIIGVCAVAIYTALSFVLLIWISNFTPKNV
jgi:hypothetical protein